MAPTPHIRPLNDTVIVRKDDPPKKDGLIEMPDQSKRPPITGTVIAVGPGRVHPALNERIPMQVQEGDRIIWPPYAMEEFTDDPLATKPNIFRVRETDIMGVFPRDGDTPTPLAALRRVFEECRGYLLGDDSDPDKTIEAIEAIVCSAAGIEPATINED